jgi:hypothetical protein
MVSNKMLIVHFLISPKYSITSRSRVHLEKVIGPDAEDIKKFLALYRTQSFRFQNKLITNANIAARPTDVLEQLRGTRHCTYCLI